MLTKTLIAAAALGAAPAFALDAPVAAPPEAHIRSMADYLETVVDPQRGIYIRDYSGRWYYARIEGLCPRLTRSASLRFDAAPGGNFDRYSTIRADGWRCTVASVTESDGPPRPAHRR
jgi:hypothetical protein